MKPSQSTSDTAIGCLGVTDCKSQDEQLVPAFLSVLLCFLLSLCFSASPDSATALPGQYHPWEDVSGQAAWAMVSTGKEVGHPAGFAGEAVHTAKEQWITVRPVFRQSDRSPAHPENSGNLCSNHTSPPATIYILSLSLSFSFCLLGEAIFVHVSSSFTAWNLLPSFPPAFTSTLLSFILSCLLLLLRFNKSPGGRREKKQGAGGCKNIYGFIYKGPRYCPALNPGEMIYFPPMCGTDPRGVTQQSTGLVLAIYSGRRGS